MPTDPFRKPRVVLNRGCLYDPTVWREDAAATITVLADDGDDGVALVGHHTGAQVAELAARDVGVAARSLVLLFPSPFEELALAEEVAGARRGCIEAPDAVAGELIALLASWMLRRGQRDRGSLDWGVRSKEARRRLRRHVRAQRHPPCFGSAPTSRRTQGRRLPHGGGHPDLRGPRVRPRSPTCPADIPRVALPDPVKGFARRRDRALAGRHRAVLARCHPSPRAGLSVELRDRTVNRLGDGYLWSGTPQA